MTKIEWVRGDDGSPGISWNCLRAEREIERKGKTITVSANHCEHVNEACRWCYAEKGNARLGGLPFKRQNRDAYRFVINREKLVAPLHRRKPTRYFVESVTDLFGEWWPREYVDQVYGVMALADWHTFVNLSKRPAARRDYLADSTFPDRLDSLMNDLAPAHWCTRELQDLNAPPLSNVIEGTSVSCQEEADEFIPILLQTKAAVRGVSCEPLLGPIDLSNYFVETARTNWDWYLDWVIVGGESGPNARPMNPQWARDIRDQCKAAGVAFFHKQNGEFASVSAVEGPGAHHHFDDGRTVRRVGKKAAGRLLDGVEHNGMPEVAPA